jgi:predicted RNA-binding protein
MCTYTIVSDADNIRLADLGPARESQPAFPGAVVNLDFAGVPIAELKRCEPAVGATCRVIRTDVLGNTQERRGAVIQVSPIVRVSLDGGDWQ